MGWQFRLPHANLVAHITTSVKRAPPRLTNWEVQEFLGSLTQSGRNGSLISNNSEWLEHIADTAHRLLKRLNSTYENHNLLIEPNDLSSLIANLRPLFADFAYYGLAVGYHSDRHELESFFHWAAKESGPFGLFLLPSLDDPREPITLLDPVPLFRDVLAKTNQWPGVLYWTQHGESSFFPFKTAFDVLKTLITVTPATGGYPSARRGLTQSQLSLELSPKAGDVIADYRRHVRDIPKRVRLLQLSDLHIGSKYATEKQAYVLAHLDSILSAVDRVIITGDLIDTPSEASATAFKLFLSILQQKTTKPVILIPGNHDQRVRGNAIFGVGAKYKELSDIEWSRLVVDDELQCVFYGFDSSRDATNFARGVITEKQLVDRATHFEAIAAKHSAIREYFPIALIHHHPYPYQGQTETLVQRILATFGLNEEQFLQMDDADRFLNWCAGRGVPLILHGHKHIPRYVRGQREWSHGGRSRLRDLTAVGCGTTLGAEGLPLSYNILQWDPIERQWGASFYSSPTIATGFEEELVTVQSVDA